MRHPCLVVILSSLLAGCGGVLPTFGHDAPLRAPVSNMAAQSGDLYVANVSANVVTVYEPGSQVPARTLASSKLFTPAAIAFDAKRDTYVAGSTGGSGGRGGISLFNASSNRPFKLITRGVNRPQALAFDKTGNLFVANAGVKASNAPIGAGSVSIYLPSQGVPISTIPWSNGICAPISLAFDRRQRLFVANHRNCSGTGSGSISIFTSSMRLTQTITSGINEPTQILFDRDGNLYVANESGGVSIYAPNATKPTRIIDPTHSVYGIALDSQGRLYELSRSVAIYPPGRSKPAHIVKLSAAVALTLDSRNNLYVGSNSGDCGNVAKKRNYGCVIVFSAKSLTRLYRIPIAGTPQALTFGPV